MIYDSEHSHYIFIVLCTIIEPAYSIMLSSLWYDSLSIDMIILIGIICIICFLFIPLICIILVIRCQRRPQEDPTEAVHTSSTTISTDICIDLPYYYSYDSHLYTTSYGSINDSYTSYDTDTSTDYSISIDSDLDGDSTDVDY